MKNSRADCKQLNEALESIYSIPANAGKLEKWVNGDEQTSVILGGKEISSLRKLVYEALICIENVLTFSGAANGEITWTLTAPVEVGEELVFPYSFAYLVGHKALRLSWGGAELYRERQFLEVGEKSTFSDRVLMLTRLPAGAELNAWSPSYGIPKQEREAIVEAVQAARQYAEAAGHAEAVAGESAESAVQSAAEAERSAEASCACAGNAEDAASRAEDAAERAENALALSGGENAEVTWKLDAPVVAGDVLTFPDGFIYLAGRKALRLSWGGAELYRGRQFLELGGQNAISNTVLMLIPLPAGAELNAWAVSSGVSKAQQEAIDQAEVLARQYAEDARAAAGSAASDAARAEGLAEQIATDAENARQLADRLDEIVENGALYPYSYDKIQEDDAPNGSRIETPAYYRNDDRLKVFYDGILLTNGLHYSEDEPLDDGKSHSITALFDVEQGAEWQFIVWVASSSTMNMTQFGFNETPPGDIDMLFEAENGTVLGEPQVQFVPF